jgi:hypothetical protein
MNSQFPANWNSFQHLENQKLTNPVCLVSESDLMAFSVFNGVREGHEPKPTDQSKQKTLVQQFVP